MNVKKAEEKIHDLILKDLTPSDNGKDKTLVLLEVESTLKHATGSDASIKDLSNKVFSCVTVWLENNLNKLGPNVDSAKKICVAIMCKLYEAKK